MRQMHDQWQAARKACGLTGNGDTQFIDDEAEARRVRDVHGKAESPWLTFRT